MKKLLICTILALALSACGEKEVSDAAAQSPQQATAPSQGPTETVASAAVSSGPRAFADSANEMGWFRLNDRETMAVAKQFTRCAIERVNGEKPVKGQPIVLPLGKDLSVSGWIADPLLHTPARFLLVLRSPHGTYATNATAGRKRADVASALKSELLADAGFLSQKPLTAVAPGEYSVSLLQFADGQYVTCGSAARVTVQ
ncbi:hypothetical protein [Lysobacter sp. H23M47]|uniref:hypothetical protein n=1 Tax=Lysobacter sp. H23M47 TaxID=2781024 RepID=UPI00187E99EF|nr:hypothetical protein [Lysobacter sp. H23M47]QOW24162.1 hypothetical protein INQ43_10685 [Lysobacter sp. H23M47]